MTPSALFRWLFPLLFFIALSPSPASAERPFSATERALPVERGRYRLEGGLEVKRFSSTKDQTTFPIRLRYGQLQNLEFGAGFSYFFGENNNANTDHLGDLFLTTKIRFLKGREANPLSIAGQIAIKLPTAGYNKAFDTSGEVDVGFMAIATKVFAATTAHINFGYLFVGKSPRDVPPQEDRLISSLGFDFKTPDPLSHLALELFGQVDRRSAVSHGQWNLLFGMAYHAEQDIYIDTSLIFGLNHYTPDRSFNIGITRFFS